MAGGEGADSVDVQADELEYEANQKLMTARGHVVVTRGKDILKADYMTVRTDTQDAHAVGNVVFDRAGNVWKGDEMSYNFKDRTGDFGEFNASIAPFYIRAENSKRTSPDEFVLHNATITTCEGDRPDVYIKAREARVIKQNTIVARGVVFYVGAVPIFYVPKWTRRHQGRQDRHRLRARLRVACRRVPADRVQLPDGMRRQGVHAPRLPDQARRRSGAGFFLGRPGPVVPRRGEDVLRE